jgi:hypothetical protein
MTGMRQRAAWWLAVPILVVGEMAGHSLAYRIVAPDAAVRARLLERTGHAYLADLHPLVGVCLVLAAAAVVQRTLASFRGRPARRVPSWRFALLPALAFILQEYTERLAYNGHVVWGTIAEPAVAVGVFLQIPCGFVALVVVRVLLRAAHEAGRVIAARTTVRVPRPSMPLLSQAHRAERPSLVALARGVAERGPPLPA